ncbi:phosphoribosylformylglycinamide cyclo-ligase [Candidatus Liberibacter solanacearum]|uniref:Phosphoribosylformylglycinamidine cyclo-ligase n=1 Tax=Candidatus Liberibacter solanacearum TaxID=556287 RepID=A0A094Z2X2_9HYPH|nr:phosphoribosylformylglycinamidine cyclo-ligase [Candidatus Liberibacter solanacearum]KGB28017.1 phosphoribosylformylglycinamidine cyclo-ligase [Candidatus Liberibacter solanacearum]KJZ80813.1 phosphoribosylformylglycinamidine cyclo-ligase [Candidatus Liberibacter solanacearum]KJZ81936.1 Phosphoribosylformylglycinamidine cyclo-ligase [Candidatus Liberibacter solanacearum]KQC49618.1 phosphoribosylformylglycinamidine cyclo-ligase [Candidatus Liberibacter solanacearum]ONI58931.1 phosphoribosylf
MNHGKENRLTYSDSGVNIEAGNRTVTQIKSTLKSTDRAGTIGEIGGFGALFDLKKAGFVDPILVSSSDGIGTKVKIAAEMGKNDTIGIDLVAMCVNDILTHGAEPLFFLDYLATSKLNPDEASDIIKGIAEGCRQAGCALIGGETAEMPGLYHGKDYDLAGFAVGAAERKELLSPENVCKGDLILGLPSSGLHSNGFSLVRKIISLSRLSWQDPSPISSQHSLGETLLNPTRIYVKPLLEVIKKTKKIKALAHITGGGLTENIPRVIPHHLMANIYLDSIKVPEIISWLSKKANIESTEILRTLNCGIGMIVIISQDNRDSIIKIFKEHGEDIIHCGEVIERNNKISPILYKGSLML